MVFQVLQHCRKKGNLLTFLMAWMRAVEVALDLRTVMLLPVVG